MSEIPEGRAIAVQVGDAMDVAAAPGRLAFKCRAGERFFTPYGRLAQFLASFAAPIIATGPLPEDMVGDLNARLLPSNAGRTLRCPILQGRGELIGRLRLPREGTPELAFVARGSFDAAWAENEFELLAATIAALFASAPPGQQRKGGLTRWPTASRST